MVEELYKAFPVIMENPYRFSVVCKTHGNSMYLLPVMWKNYGGISYGVFPVLADLDIYIRKLEGKVWG